MDHFRGVNTSPEKMNLQDKPRGKLEWNPTCSIIFYCDVLLELYCQTTFLALIKSYSLNFSKAIPKLNSIALSSGGR